VRYQDAVILRNDACIRVLFGWLTGDG